MNAELKSAMEPRRSVVVNGVKIQEFFWNGRTIVHVEGTQVGETFDEAIRSWSEMTAMANPAPDIKDDEVELRKLLELRDQIEAAMEKLRELQREYRSLTGIDHKPFL